MKKLLIASLFLINAVAFAQAQISAGLTIGPAIPSGGYSKFAGIGFGFAAEGRYAINDMLSVGMNIGHYRTPVKDLFLGGTVPLVGNYNVTPITAVSEYYILDEDIRPYVGLELGAVITGFTWNVENNGQDIEFRKDNVVGIGVAPVAGALYEINDGLEVSANMKYMVSGAAIQIDEERGVHMFTINFGVRITPSEF